MVGTHEQLASIAATSRYEPNLTTPEEVHYRRRDDRAGVGDHAGGERHGGDQEVASGDEDSGEVEP